jgi:hypothetical protein
MLEITAADISSLNDIDLRTLVARLCEAELRGANLPVAAVMAGGHQNAADGGLDVRVQLASGAASGGFVPRANVGFQVKVPDMPPSAIKDEMMPGGTLRPVIAELAAADGAYIIVSSGVTASDSMLGARRAAMANAVVGLPSASRLHLDFYDRDRIARWVGSYPGITAWVRERIGKPIQGWQAFGNWSSPGSPADSEYLCDDQARIRDGRNPSDGDLPANEGVRRIREVLASHKGVVRLIGLSGLGKTRLVQALFDERIGVDALAPSLVVYTDMAHEPSPSPRDFLQSFISSRQRVILVVDNCKPTTHKVLASVCAEPDSQASIITVEYDVGEDEPEDTHVFRLEPASDEIIEKLISIRSPDISQVDRRRLADFSGGNARIALALARTIKRGDSVSILTDRELFSRLFNQGRDEDQLLLRAAEACALVYSFDGETSSGDSAELPAIASLAGQSSDDLYRHIAELRRRDLVQQRSKWRAVLPHALANKLARQALEQLVPERVEATLVIPGRERLAKSFSRRLGYLHDCEAARRLVEKWLGDGGHLSKPHELSVLGWEMFDNVAPVLPEATLDVLERSLQEDGRVAITDLKHPSRHKYTRLLRALAFDAKLFDRSARLLLKFVVAEPFGYNQDSAQDTFKELFRIFLSGTHATFEQRERIVSELLCADDKRTVESGLMALDEMLEARHFSSFHRFHFGARSRDYGWAPRTAADISDWYRQVINLMIAHWQKNKPLRDHLRAVFAKNFRTLWARAQVYGELNAAIENFSSDDCWIDGWLSVKETLRFDRQRMSDAVLRQLQEIEERLKPKDLLNRARAYVLSDAWRATDLTDELVGNEDPASAYNAAEKHASDLGRAIVQDREALTAILQESLSGNTSGRRHSFGMGLAEGAGDLDEIWALLIDHLRAVPQEQKNLGVLTGYLAKAASMSADFVERVLDSALCDPLLGFWFPVLQRPVPLDDKGGDRLIKSIRLGVAPIHFYHYLNVWGAAPISPSKIKDLLLALSEIEGGPDVSLEILHLCFLEEKKEPSSAMTELIACGRRLLEKYDFVSQDANSDYRLKEVAERCLVGADAADLATSICSNILTTALKGSGTIYAYKYLLHAMFKLQPVSALNAFLSDDELEYVRWILADFSWGKGSSIDEVPADIMIAWAQLNIERRFGLLAEVIPLFRHEDGEGNQELSPASLALLDACPNTSLVLSKFDRRLRPSSWMGPLAPILDRRRAALRILKDHPNSEIAQWASRADLALHDWANKERASTRRDDQSFE